MASPQNSIGIWKRLTKLSHSNGEGSEVIEAVLRDQILGDVVLLLCVLTGDLGDGSPKKLTAVGEPSDHLVSCFRILSQTS